GQTPEAVCAVNVGNGIAEDLVRAEGRGVDVRGKEHDMDALDGTAGGLVGNRAADVAGQREGGVDAPRVAALAERDHAADPERALAVVPLAHVLALAAVDEQHLVPTRGQEGQAIGSVRRIPSTEF